MALLFLIDGFFSVYYGAVASQKRNCKVKVGVSI